MALYACPQHDSASTARSDVLWRRGDPTKRGLLIDSSAVPLRFMGDLQADEPALAGRVVVAFASPETTMRVRRTSNLIAVRAL